MTTPAAPAAAPAAATRHPATWIPTLFFAEGLPFAAVAVMAQLVYQSRGVPNNVITLYTSWLLLPWSLKPITSPLLELFRTKKFFVVLFQLLGGATLVLIALSLPLPSYFTYTLALFALLALWSSTHDIAADGLYIASLAPKEQAAYAGWLGAFWNLGKILAQGGLVALAGYLTVRMGLVSAWMAVFGVMGGLLVLLGLYHGRVLPRGGEERKPESFEQIYTTFVDVFRAFLKKPYIWLFMLFILLFRLGESQVEPVGRLFLRAARDAGGLGLTDAEFGTIYGIFGSLAFIVGSIAGGYFASRLGLKRALFPLICFMNFPNATFLYLSAFKPTSLAAVSAAVIVEKFGYGFGFVAVTLLMMQEIAPGKYQMAHYAFANSVMNFGLIPFGAISGKLQIELGYTRFFVWVLISAIPALVLSRFLPIRGGEAPAPAATSA